MNAKKGSIWINLFRFNSIQILLIGLLVVIMQLACSRLMEELSFFPISTPTNTPSPTLTLSDSGKIVFMKLNQNTLKELWMVNADGSNLEQLTNSPEDIIWFRWSPDGKYILYLIGFKLWDLGVFNIDNSNQIPNLEFLNGMHLHNGFSLSPDGTKIAYQWKEDFYDWEIWVMDIDGSNRVQLTDSDGGSPSWSPDGSQIAYHSGESCDWNYDDYDDDPYLQGVEGGYIRKVKITKIIDLSPVYNCSGLWVMDADGSNQVQLTDFPISGEVWSPDSSKLAFLHDREGGIWLVSADGSGLNQLTNKSRGRSIEWSPDGSKIAFKSNQNGIYDLWLMDADGSNQVQLTDDPAHEELGNWSPDGSRIVFSSNGNIWIINKDGSGLTQLTSGGGNYRPVWQPGLQD